MAGRKRAFRKFGGLGPKVTHQNLRQVPQQLLTVSAGGPCRKTFWHNAVLGRTVRYHFGQNKFSRARSVNGARVRGAAT